MPPQQIPPRSSPTFEIIARIGYATRGAVFLLVGFVALTGAIGARVAAPAPHDIFSDLLQQPFGRGLLILIAAGLFCFALWRLLQALLNADHCSNDLRGWGRRAAYLGSALFYLGMAAVPLGMVSGWSAGARGDQPVHDWTAWLLSIPAGRWLVAAIGAGIAIAGVVTAVSGVRARFEKRLELKREPRRFVTTLARFGFVARACIFVLIGAFLVFAAVYRDPGQARGLAGAFRLIQQQPLGSFLLAITAAGFIAFGSYEIAEAAARRITAPSLRKPVAKALTRP